MGIQARARILVVTAATAVAPLLGVDSVRAQDQEDSRGGAGFFSVGAAFPRVSDLNRSLEASGYPTMGRSALAIGGGGYSERAGGWLVGGEGYGIFSGEEAIDGRSVSVGGGYGLFTVGYLAYQSPRFRVYPRVGLGGGGLSLRIGSQATGDSFDDVLENPNRMTTLDRGSFLVSFGAGTEFRNVPGGRGLLVGLQAGYMASIASSSWSLDGDRIGAGPSTSLAGPYLRIMIGGGGQRR